MKDLVQLINLAQGERTLNQYAQISGISKSMLSLIKSGQRKPSADILLKLSKHARNNVTYKDLMKSAGYWDDSQLSDEQIVNSDPKRITVIGYGIGKQEVELTDEKKLLLKMLLSDKE